MLSRFGSFFAGADCYQFIRFLGSTWPVLQPSIQSISKRSAAKLSLRPAWKARHGLELWQKFWGRWLERKHERSNKTMTGKNWKVKVLHFLMWILLWNIVMNRVHGRLQHWYRDIIGWDLWRCTGVCYVVGKQPGRGGQPVMFGSSDKKSVIWCDFWCEGHFWCDWIGAWLPLQAWISQISWISWITDSGLTHKMSQFSCEGLHQPRWRKPDGRHWPLHLCPVAKIRSNTEAMYVFSMNSFMCSSSSTEYTFPFAKGHDFMFPKVTGVVDIAPRSTVGPGLSLLSLGCSGGCSEALKEIMSDNEAM